MFLPQCLIVLIHDQAALFRASRGRLQARLDRRVHGPVTASIAQQGCRKTGLSGVNFPRFRGCALVATQ
jgi:hypothetical protein